MACSGCRQSYIANAAASFPLTMPVAGYRGATKGVIRASQIVSQQSESSGSVGEGESASPPLSSNPVSGSGPENNLENDTDET